MTTDKRRRHDGDAASSDPTAGADGVRGFEEAMSQLEEIAQALESGQLPLEEALTVYEQGMRLAQLCQTLLDRADLRVRRLVVSEDGDLTMQALALDIEP